MQIYLITNKINGKIYVGQCLGLARDRWCRHKYDARLNRYPSRIGNAIRKYGDNAFDVSILVNNVASKELLDYLEQYFIVMYDTRNPDIGYNLTDGGDGAYGLKMSSEACAKIGKTKIGNKNCVGRFMSEATRNKISEGNKKHWATVPIEQRKWKESSKQKLIATIKGKKHTAEHIKKFQEIMFLKTIA